MRLPVCSGYSASWQHDVPGMQAATDADRASGASLRSRPCTCGTGSRHPGLFLAHAHTSTFNCCCSSVVAAEPTLVIQTSRRAFRPAACSSVSTLGCTQDTWHMLQQLRTLCTGTIQHHGTCVHVQCPMLKSTLLLLCTCTPEDHCTSQ